MNTDTLLHGLGYGAVYSALGLALLLAGYLLLDLLTPGRLGAHLLGGAKRFERGAGHSVRGPSASAGLVTGAWLLGQGLVIFTAIWTNAASGFGEALVDTAAFGVLGILALTVAYVVVDLVTPGRLGDSVCEPGAVRPLAVVLASALLAMAAIICASIA